MVLLQFLAFRRFPEDYQQMTEEQGTFDIQETYPLQEQVATAEGWEEPSMDDYNDYDAHRQ